MKKTVEPAQNLLDLKPARILEWETGENEQVVLLVPKFRTGILARWLMPRISKPCIRVKLDNYGSLFWKLCDGNTTVFGIVEKMRDQFGSDFDPDYRRIGAFVSQLSRDKFINVIHDSITNS